MTEYKLVRCSDDMEITRFSLSDAVSDFLRMLLVDGRYLVNSKGGCWSFRPLMKGEIVIQEKAHNECEQLFR